MQSAMSLHHVHHTQLQVEIVVQSVHLHRQVDEDSQGDANHQHIASIACGARIDTR